MLPIIDGSFKIRLVFRNRALPGNIDDRRKAARSLRLLRALASGFATAALHSLW